MNTPNSFAVPGFWPSSFSASDALTGTKEYGQLIAADANTLYWVEYQPEQGGRTAICRIRLEQKGTMGESVECLTPDNVSVRSRVHEYGGQSWCLLSDQLVYVDAADQQLWRQSLSDRSVQPLTQSPDCRYGAPVWDRSRNRLLAVQEVHSATDEPDQVVNRLVAIALDSGQVSVLHEGYDFYDQPVLGGSNQVAWISWDHPHQPWTETRLVTAEIDPSGDLQHVTVRVEDGQSLTQPQYDAQGQLHVITDISDWWQICRVEGAGDAVQLTPLSGQKNAEYAAAGWQLGQQSYQLVEGRWIAYCHRNGIGELHHFEDGQLQRLAAEYTAFRSVVVIGNSVFCVAYSAARNASLIRVDLSSSAVQVLEGGEQILPDADVSRSSHLTFNVGEEQSHALFYPPANQEVDAEDGLPPVLPPLVVFLHGGPTSAAYPMFNPKIQYWTQRGFAVADLNYRGSTGYGRRYRMKLAKAWGVADVEDCVALVEHLSTEGLVNPNHVFIRGGSAGGYTALAALAASNCFTAGASLYGVSDLKALCVSTHKFESRYLDWLIGDPVAHAERYRERSPVTQADQIHCPVIFFQGLLDKVVPPEQTDLMAEALATNGVTVDVHRYPDEYHGFRDPCVQQEVLEKELAFYRRWI